MASTTTRPKRNNSPINSKHQPLKATVPFQSLLRNPSPTRRRTSPCSPVLPPDKRNRIRRSPDTQTNEHRTLLSPLGSKGKCSLLLPQVFIKWCYFDVFKMNT